MLRSTKGAGCYWDWVFYFGGKICSENHNSYGTQSPEVDENECMQHMCKIEIHRRQ